MYLVVFNFINLILPAINKLLHVSCENLSQKISHKTAQSMGIRCRQGLRSGFQLPQLCLLFSIDVYSRFA